MSEIWQTLWHDEDGQDLTEYALILVLISLIALAILRTIGSVIHNTYSNASSKLSATS